MPTKEATFTVVPIRPEVAAYVREHGRDPVWGHRAETQLATGFGPCRACLQTFRAGEEQRTLFTHDSYAGVSEFTQPGPVFIHTDGCEAYDGEGFPPDLRDLSLTFEAIAEGPLVLARRHPDGRDADTVIEELLAMDGVQCVNIRNTEAGCLVARVELARS